MLASAPADRDEAAPGRSSGRLVALAKLSARTASLYSGGFAMLLSRSFLAKVRNGI